jgi:hypothetical protein
MKSEISLLEFITLLLLCYYFVITVDAAILKLFILFFSYANTSHIIQNICLKTF